MVRQEFKNGYGLGCQLSFLNHYLNAKNMYLLPNIRFSANTLENGESTSRATTVCSEYFLLGRAGKRCLEHSELMPSQALKKGFHNTPSSCDMKACVGWRRRAAIKLQNTRHERLLHNEPPSRSRAASSSPLPISKPGPLK